MIKKENPLNAWMGNLPTGWEKRRLKYIFSIKKDIAGEEGHTVLSVTQQGVVPKNMEAKGQFAADYSKYQLVNQGEFVMNHMDLLTGWVDISKYDGVTSPDYRVFVLDDSEKYCAEYYKFIFQLCYKHRIFYSLGQGVSGFGRWRLPADMFLNFELPVPQYTEQKKIADYLKVYSDGIDEIIASSKLLVDEYQNLKLAAIYEAVTKGLEKNRTMKDSCIEWEGDVPEDWELVPLKYLFSFEKGKNAATYTQEYIGEHPGSFPVYSGQTANNGVMGVIDSYDYDIDECLFTTTVGAKVMTPSILHGKFSLSQNCLIMKKISKCCIRYIYYLLLPLFAYEKAKIPSYMQPSLRIQDLRTYKFYIPSYEEQVQIADYLDDLVGKMDNVIDEKVSLVKDLETFKVSSMYECVTGKRRVV